MDVTISVEQLDVMDFLVTVIDRHATTQHTVVATQQDHELYAPNASLQDLITETFRFLLSHEAHSMIEDHFSLEDVARLFPDYEFEMKRHFT